MIQNNNTPDVAYLGYTYKRRSSTDIYSLPKLAPLLGVPVGKKYSEECQFLFDCNGTRYGFRIKTLKTK